eukprot:EG_transcript_9959
MAGARGCLAPLLPPSPRANPVARPMPAGRPALAVAGVALLGLCLGSIMWPPIVVEAWLWGGRRATQYAIQNPAAVRKVADANTKFTKDLYMGVRDRIEGNMVVSPASLSAALALAALGAGPATHAQLAAALAFPDAGALHPGMADVLRVTASNANFTLVIANRLWVADGFKPTHSFAAAAAKHYPAGVEAVDFARPDRARHAINAWVQARARGGRLRDTVPADALDAATSGALVSAVYFKGSWLRRFDPAQTTAEPFHYREGVAGRVHMMHLTGSFRVSAIQRLDATILELPYKGDRLSFIIILPNERFGLSSVEDKLPSYDLNQVNTKLMMAMKRRTALHFPRFALDSTHNLTLPLQELGVTAAFSPMEADFSVLTRQPGLHLSLVLQRAVLQVNEQGCEAEDRPDDAEDEVPRAKSAARGPAPPFVCDHPFLFVVKDRLTRMILFAGRVTHPEPAK